MIKRFSTALMLAAIFLISYQEATAQPKRLYIANDDHTDYVWTQTESVYKQAFLDMLDRWMFINDSTKAAQPLNPNLQSKWNCDGSFWISVYEKIKGTNSADFARLIQQIKNGQITVPYSPLVVAYGGVPLEAVIRGMYYAGDLERRYGFDFSMATAMENQTMPLGLHSIWKGSGAKYCWHGVCACDTKMDKSGFESREKEIYWAKGIDTNKILMKWYKMVDYNQNTRLGGYAEIYEPNTDVSIDDIAAKTGSADYPFNIAAAFGVGHDNLLTLNDALVNAARNKTNVGQTVIVSNEVDFFQDFENTYGATLPTQTKTFGNEWDLNCASMAEVSARVKRSVEKLRAAEAMAAIVINYNVTFMDAFAAERKQAWESIGLYWEHSMGFIGNSVSEAERVGFQNRLQTEIAAYADLLYTAAKAALGRLIQNGTANKRFFAFNPLGWERTDYADFEYSGDQNIHVFDVTANVQVPHQQIIKNGKKHLRVLAANIPSVGYRVFEIRTGPGPSAFPDAGSNAGNVLESDLFKITYTNAGVLTSVIDKNNSNKELVKPGAFLNDLGSGNANLGNITAVENGAVFIRVTTASASPIPHTTNITLYKNIPRIEIDNQITTGFNDSVKTWNYSFDVNNPTVWHEEVGAVIKAKLDNNGGHYAVKNARYDWNTLNHFASVNDNTGYGISLSNQDCFFMQIGNSTVTTLDENSADLKILSGGKIGGLGFNNQGGETELNQRFAITTHTAYSAVNEMKKALEHQNFLVCDSVYEPANFLLPSLYSFVKSSDPGSLIWAVKPAEETNNGLITRVWNLTDADATSTLEYNLFINQAKRTTHVETNMNDIAVSAGTPREMPVALGHNEMKTYRIKLYPVVLPLKLISFSGYKVTGANELQWKTAEEINFKEYQLERSTDGRSFTTVTTVKANGSSTGANYTFADNATNTDTRYYYRLKMVNNDNSFAYSNILIIKANTSANNMVIYPNPVTNVINANIVLNRQVRCRVMVLNAAGAMVKTTQPPLFEKGYNTYSVSVKELPAGNYSLVITTGAEKYIQYFIKK